MNKNICIISTYPENGSKNIGDLLITNKLKTLISEFGEYDFQVIWREDPWEKVKDKILSTDHIFFACLAIRPNMHVKEYPYLEKIVVSGVPFSVISAGTDLKINDSSSIFDGFSLETINLLITINDKAIIKTTRGYLSQEFCTKMGLDKFSFSGDVAFYSKFANKKFSTGKTIKRIVISDPHRTHKYIDAFSCLYSGIREMFPESKIEILQHGVNNILDNYCKKNNIETIKIYEQPDIGLDIYDNADLHVGFRVHGHVSALSRGCYSYLLEQDGRGCDYGLTIDRKISVPNYQSPNINIHLKDIIAFWFNGRRFEKFATVSPVEQVIALIRADKDRNFSKFEGLNQQIDGWNMALFNAIKYAIAI